MKKEILTSQLVESTYHIQSAFLSFEKQNKFSQEEISSIQQGWEPMAMSMYMLMHKHNLIDENLKGELEYLGTFDFYNSLCLNQGVQNEQK